MCGIDEYPEAPAYKITSKISLSSTEVLIIHMAENEYKAKNSSGKAHQLKRFRS